MLSPKGDLCVCISESGTLHCFATTDTLSLAAPATAANGSGYSGATASSIGGGGRGGNSSSSASGAVTPSASIMHRGGGGGAGAGDRSRFDPMDPFSTTANGGYAGTNALVPSAHHNHGSGGGGPQHPTHNTPSSGSSFFGVSAAAFLPQRYHDAMRYMASYSAFATAPVLDDGESDAYAHSYDYKGLGHASASAEGGNGGAVHVPLTAAFCCAALRPEVGGRFRVVVAVGGLSSQSKARCLHVDVDASEARRVATFIFPRDLL